MEFKHVLITRFNIYYKTKMAEKGHDPEIWLNERFEIFRKFCFPSIINQSNKKFTWLIYVDSETPVEVFTELEKMTGKYSFIRLIKRKFTQFSLRPYLNHDICEQLSEDFEYLISSRVDTDDMLHRDFIETTQSCFKGQKYEALNFNKGYVYDIKTGVSAVKIHKYNAFISLVEKRGGNDFKTVFHQIHIKFRDDPNKKEILMKEPMWCVTVHNLNVSTGFYGRIFKLYQPNLKELFAFDFQKTPTLENIFKLTIRSYTRTLNKVVSKIKSFFSL